MLDGLRYEQPADGHGRASQVPVPCSRGREASTQCGPQGTGLQLSCFVWQRSHGLCCINLPSPKILHGHLLQAASDADADPSSQ